MGILDGLRACAGCRGTGGPLCTACRAGFARPPYAVDRGDALPLPALASAVYEGPVREALVAFKDHGRWGLREPLGSALARSVAALVLTRHDETRRACSVGAPEEGAQRFLLVPAPSSPQSVHERDGAHVVELAERVRQRVAPLLRTEVVAGLVVVRRRRDQVGLGHQARNANLRGSLRATDALVDRAARPGTAVIVLDDVCTTGATLAEAHRALLAAGVRPWGAAVVAATPALPLRSRHRSG